MKKEFFELIEKRKSKKSEYEMVSAEYHEEIQFQNDEDLQREALATVERLWWELQTIENRMADIRREAGSETMREWRNEYRTMQAEKTMVVTPIIDETTLPF